MEWMYLPLRQQTKKSGAKVHLYVNAGLIVFICREAVVERQVASSPLLVVDLSLEHSAAQTALSDPCTS